LHEQQNPTVLAPSGFVFLWDGWLKRASGGKVCHLESRLRMRFAPRSSGKSLPPLKRTSLEGNLYDLFVKPALSDQEKFGHRRVAF